MRIILTSVFVDNQDKALKFYIDKLGFIKKTEVTAGQYRWLTVVSPEDPNGVELLLDSENPAARTYKKAIYSEGIPAALFGVDNVEKEYERLKSLGVTFTMEPTNTGPSTIAVFDDTCGNLIQIQKLHRSNPPKTM